MSGGLSDFSSIGILVLNSSFCIGLFAIVMFGCAAWNPVTTACQMPRSGWEVPLFCHVRVILAVEPLLDVLPLPALLVLLLPPLLLHAAIARLIVAATEMAATFGLIRMCGSSPENVGHRAEVRAAAADRASKFSASKVLAIFRSVWQS